MNHARTRRLTAGAVAISLLAGVLTLLVMQPAQANHGSHTLQVSKEVQSGSVGTAFSLLATISPALPATAEDIKIDFEISGGPGDSDGGYSPESPDRTCTIAAGDTTCAVDQPTGADRTITSASAGVSLVRAWIDHDGLNSNVEADPTEGRLSNGTPDGAAAPGVQVPSGADCTVPEDYSGPSDVSGCGAGPTAVAEAGLTPEPDLTDVVSLQWNAGFATLDCDGVNSGTDDEVAAPLAAASVRCTARDNASALMAGVEIDGENLDGVNDPDNADAGPADYGTQAEDPTVLDPAPNPGCVTDDTGSCTISLPTEGQTGSATICLWRDDGGDEDDYAGSGAAAEDGGGCSNGGEPVAETEANDGLDALTVRWASTPEATKVNLEPETSNGTVGASHTVTASVFDQFDNPKSGEVVKFEFSNGSAADSGGSTPAAPFGQCTTGSGGSCALVYTSTSLGTDTLCGWIKHSAAGPTMSTTGTRTCDGETAANDVVGTVDVVTRGWSAPAATTTTAGPTTTTTPPAEDVAKSQGYTLVGADGGIYNFGTSQFHGSTGSMKLNQPVIGLANKKGGTGYWLVARDGGIFTFGDAEFFGSTGSMTLNAPILGMEATPSGKGYYLFAADGGIFTFGDAQFHGSTGNMKLNAPAVGLSINSKGDGYWLVAQDGGIFSFGDAENKFYGSAVGSANGTVIGMGATPTFNGYWISDSAGGVFPFGDARALGDRRGQANNAPIVGFATVPKA